MRTEQNIKDSYEVTAGVMEYAVRFPLYEEGDVAVWLSSDGGVTERRLVLGREYSVRIGSGRSGGMVRLAEGVAASGDMLALVSSLPYTQELDLSSTATISTEQTEIQLDRTTQQIQQLAEHVGRNLCVPVTSSKAPEQVMQELLDTASTANEYAKKSEEIYQEVLELREDAEDLLADAGDRQIERIEEEGERQWSRAAAEADRAENAADIAALTHYVSGAEDTWIVDEDRPAGSIINLPLGLAYLVGRHHLRIGYDGVIMSPTFFEEQGEPGEASVTVKILFPLYKGQELDFWIIPLGEAGEILEEVRAEGQAQIEAACACATEAETQATAAAASATKSEAQATAAAASAADSDKQAKAAANSATAANNSAAAAANSADEARQAVESGLAALEETGTQQVQRVTEEGDKQVQRVENVGNTVQQTLTDARTQIEEAGNEQVQLIEEAGTTVQQTVNSGLTALEETGTQQVQRVTEEGDKQVQRVEEAGTAQTTTVESAGAAQKKAVEAAGAAQAAAVESAGIAQSSAVELAGAQQVTAVQEAAAEQVQAAATSAAQAAASAQKVQEFIGQVYKYKGTVETYDKLPTSGQENGDVYNVADTDMNYAWIGTGWDSLGSKPGFIGTLDSTPTADSENPVASGGTYAAIQEVKSAAVLLTGNQSIAGTKTFTASPVVPTAAATDNTTKAASTAYVTRAVGAAEEKCVPLAGGTMTGLLSLSGNPTANEHAANKAYVDAQDKKYLPLAGGTMTGNITVSNNTAGTIYTKKDTGLVSGTAPDAARYIEMRYLDSASKEIGVCQIIANTDGSNASKCLVRKPGDATLSAEISVYYPATGTPYGAAPNPDASSNTNHIATTSWVNTAISSKAVLLTGNQTIAGTKTFSTTPVVQTAAATDNTTKAASTAYVTRAANAVKTEAEKLDCCTVTALTSVPSTLREGGLIILKTTV